MSDPKPEEAMTETERAIHRAIVSCDWPAIYAIGGERDALRSTNARLRGALALADDAIEDGEHQQGCRVFTVPLAESPGACDCGWAPKVLAYREARAALEGKPRPSSAPGAKGEGREG